MSLTDLLGATSSLSLLTTAVKSVPGLAESLGSLSNVTILAPSNDAFSKFTNTSGSATALAMNDTGAIQAFLQYHILNGTYPSSAVMETPVFLPTMLNDSMYTNVTGGQVVEAVKQGDSVVFYSGLLSNTTVTMADQNFTGGVVHIIDTVLTVPENISATAVDAGLSGVAGALEKAQLADTVDQLSDVTIFAPNNSAFQSIGSALPNLTVSQLANILQYHGKSPYPTLPLTSKLIQRPAVINGTVAYSPTLTNGTSIPSLLGPNLTITIADGGDVFVNSAKVLIPDILVANGVVHVIDNVLNPNNTVATPMPTASVQMPAFSGASSMESLGDLTTGVPSATGQPIGAAPTMAGEPSSTMEGGASSTSASGAALPMRTGAVGAAALFAGAGVWLNA
ncbi:interferon-induced GTP-binding protein Mx2 [Physcia stellaris]|nr:interferon-induced GTP-binding protein Mx2 [Physcia stellaris]